MLNDFLAARNISQKWKYEKRFIHTYTKDHLVSTLNYYKNLNYFSSGCLMIGGGATETSGYFANVCARTSIDAIKHIEEALRKGSYKKDEYICAGVPVDLDTGVFDAREGLSIPPRKIN